MRSGCAHRLASVSGDSSRILITFAQAVAARGSSQRVGPRKRFESTADDDEV